MGLALDRAASLTVDFLVANAPTLALAAVLVYVVYYLGRMGRAFEEQRRTLEEQRREINLLKDNGPLVMTDELFDRLRGATFALLDRQGHPAACAFFVSPCGVALTAAHASDLAVRRGGRLTFLAATYNGEEFTLELVSPNVEKLDVAVLRVVAPASTATPLQYSFLPLPSRRLSRKELLGAPVALIHGSIAWSAAVDAAQDIARNDGNVITSNDRELQYSIATYKGHSGTALLFRSSGQLIGLHSEGFNDLDQVFSEGSPSTSALAVRLDVEEVKAAVEAAMTRVRRKGSRPPGDSAGDRADHSVAR